MEKWCIKRTYENGDVVNEFMNKLDPNNSIYSSYSGYCYSENILKPGYKNIGHGFSNTNSISRNREDFDHSDYRELTFDEFKELVLGKEINPTYEIY